MRRWVAGSDFAFILDAMSSAYCQRFGDTALRIEHVSGDARRLLCPAVILAKSFFVGSEGSLAERDRQCHIAIGQ
jgi:hypothetical protein